MAQSVGELSPSSISMCWAVPCVEASPNTPPAGSVLGPVPGPPYGSGLFSVKTGWGFAGIEMVSSWDLKH